MIVKRNEIWLANLHQRDGSEQGGARPAVILQNDVGNFHSPTIILAPITNAKALHIPTHIFIKADGYFGVTKDSVIMLEQIQTIDKTRLIKRYDTLTDEDAALVDKALAVSLALRG